MKYFALYLPQFHRIKENDEWWGEGYTEWTAVKRSQPIFMDHIQPIKPLDDNYYDLSDYRSIMWQAKLAKNYCVSGFVMYHYWYSGKKMLETPCEILLKHSEINIEYCMCWANHPWTKAWDGKEHHILQPQTYGDISEWEQHIGYLEQFFMDSRYFRIDNKPVLFIYNASNIPEYDKRMEYYNDHVKKIGCAGIYVVQFISSKNTRKFGKVVDAVFEDEPLYSARFEISNLQKCKRVFSKKTNRPDILDYDDLWKRIINKKRTYDGTSILRGCFCSFDNSPRRGAKQPTIVHGANPNKFGYYLSELIKTKRKDQIDDIIIINAWNEWGETAMLEPSDRYGYGFLEELRRVNKTEN